MNTGVGKVGERRERRCMQWRIEFNHRLLVLEGRQADEVQSSKQALTASIGLSTASPLQNLRQ